MKSRVALPVVIAVAVAACVGASNPEETPTTHEVGGPTVPTVDLTPFQVPDHLLTMAAAWDTDFTKTTIDLNELLVGIPSADPRDAIPPIDNPRFDPVPESDWIQGPEPGVLLEIDGVARFYPLSIMTRHEIVNDVVGDVPVAVTYCPLCNTALVFDRRFEGETLRLGVSGLLRNSDLVMWDDKTHTLWQQITGEGIVGEHAGKSLTPVASAIVRWADFETEHPDGEALGPDQGYGRSYGANPYEFYSSRDRPYGFFSGDIDERYPALERVVGLSLEDSHKAYPFSLLSEARVVNDVVNDAPVVVFWGAAQTSDALGSRFIAEAEGVGTGVAYSAVVRGRQLTFEATGDVEFVDKETGSTWSILGTATSGSLTGEQLELLPHRNEFWFAYQAFFPSADVWEG